MKKIVKKSLTLIFATAFILTSIVNYKGISEIFAMGGQINELNVESLVQYDAQNISASIGVNVSKVNKDMYEIKHILGPSKEELDFNDPRIIVDKNGEYLLKVQYIDKSQPKSVIEEVDKEENIEITKQDEKSGIDSDENIDSKTNKSIAENAEEQSVLEPEIKEIDVIANVTQIVELQDIVESNDIDEKETSEIDLPQSDVSELPQADEPEIAPQPYGLGVTDLDAIFDTNNILVMGRPKSQSTNVNPKIDGNYMTTYDAKSNGGVPTSEWMDTPRWTWGTNSLIKSKVPISMKANWTFDFNFSAIYKTGVNQYSVLALVGADGSRIEITIGSVGIGLGTNTNPITIYAVDSNGSAFKHISTKIGNGRYFDLEQNVNIVSKYNTENDSVSIYLMVNGISVPLNDLPIAWLADEMEMQFSGSVTWGFHMPDDTGQRGFPTKPIYSKFNSFKYDYFEPLFEDLRWYDANGVELNDTTSVKADDELTVKVKVKNDVTTGDTISAKLYLSDEDEEAKTYGIVPSMEIIQGIPVILTKNSQEVVFKVKVKDTIGDISLGLRLEDDFFHQKQYKQVSSNISTGEIIMEGYPMYTVMEYGRDENGKITKDSNGNPTFVEAENQNFFTQDSFAKVDYSLANPRSKEAMNVVIKFTDIKNKLLGFDYSNISDFKIVNGTGTSADLETGLTFTLANNYGTGSLSYIVPVKQTGEGAPFDVQAQLIDCEIEGTFQHAEEGILKGIWNKTSIVSNNDVRPIKDIDVFLSTTVLNLEREQQFDLRQKSEPFLLFISSSESSVDYDSLRFENLGEAAILKKFGLDSNIDYIGKINGFTEDGTTMESSVIYNEIVLLDGNKHYTRLGVGANAQPRTKVNKITLNVHGGITLPDAYLEIPSSLYLSDQGGIDEEHAGAKLSIKIKDVNTDFSYDVKGDTDFSIRDQKEDFQIVSLFDENKTELSKSGSIATLGTFNKEVQEKIVWLNTKIDRYKDYSKYQGSMNFYITLGE